MGALSSMRAVGAILYRISNGASSKCSFKFNSFAPSKHYLLSRNQLSSKSSISSWAHFYEVKLSNYQLRTIRTSPLVCMGRRSCKIAGRKVSLSLYLFECVFLFVCLFRGSDVYFKFTRTPLIR